ncbi:class I SAM-dependent methyltransferase [Paenibacillus pasadenensis]|uniref:class I SAM-dependent methyltransferase n=1 Tax=Paenibacillus pasadenensis TaxID=217090 RepID=UPI00203F8043|nr:class I SAM-dependent methyltransferase [Paenibacillus pasadenensis]MCM3745876.1 class I SAM-dependent methyltransferase [Paenibacillus pasadenensis]
MNLVTDGTASLGFGMIIWVMKVTNSKGEIVRPKTEELLAVVEGQTILDIACGNGNFSRRLADLGAKVVTFDYSSNMIERAKLRSKNYSSTIDYQVIDATSFDSLIKLGSERYDMNQWSRLELEGSLFPILFFIGR